MQNIRTFYGFAYSGVKFYDVTGASFERSMDELVRDMKAKHIV
jgi:hypothetical protein